MRRKISIALLTFVLGFYTYSKADEGMWLPFLIGQQNYAEMQRLGLKLSPEQLYSINQASLKDAIVMLDGGSCTGEMISKEGLLLTNHHCAYDNIQQHSSVEHDYLTDGFWAMSRKEELPNPGKTASFLIRIEDVSDRINQQLTDDMNWEERSNKVAEISEQIVGEATQGTHYNAEVNSMFQNNYFYLFVYETFQDVRLVGAPPSSIGNYGDDTDNWMWPRHTGDFSLYRVYAGKDGKPAAYADDNVPYIPKHHLPVSVKGVQANDFAMIWGYPGTTDRYLPSRGLKMKLDQTSPHSIKLETEKLRIMKEYMDKEDKIRIQYASKQAGIANYWKKTIEEAKALKRLKVYDQKKMLENQFTQWIQQDETRKVKYGNVLADIEDAYNQLESSQAEIAKWYIIEVMFFQGAEVLGFSYNFGDLQQQLTLKQDTKDLIEALKAEAKPFYKDYNADIDKNIMVSLLNMYSQNISKDYHPGIFDLVHKKYKGDFNRFAEQAYKTSIFTDEQRLNTFLENPNAKTIEKDLIYQTASSFFEAFVMKVSPRLIESNTKLANARRLFVAGLMEMQKDKVFYPDANSTMRVTYGTVKDYFPRDAVHYHWQTFLEGVMQKEDPQNPEFIVPEKLKRIYETKDYGIYGMGNKMPVNFLTDNDITGGNSGSPVINSNGELIGAAFDGNSEAMSSDIEFDEPLQRTIVADIRYILLVIDKYAGAKHLVDEMTIVKD